jgi:two-component system sensor histidine kinase KdpD
MNWKRLTSWYDGYPFALLAVAVACIVMLPLRPDLSPPLIGLLLVPVIVAVARLSSARASALAAVVAFLGIDVLYVPPYYHLTVAEPSAWIGLLVFLIVALVLGRQTGRLRERERAALHRQQEFELLNRMSFRVVSEKSAHGIAEFVVRQLVATLDARRVALYVVIDGNLGVIAEGGPAAQLPDEAEFAGWVLREGKAVGFVEAEVPADQRPVSVAADQAIPGAVAAGAYLPLQTADWFEGVLFALPGHDGPPTPDEARLLAAVANLSASCFARQHLEAEATHAEALREADGLKSTLVSSVSHELKTPLAAATASITGLLDESGPRDPRLREELEAVADSLRRLDSSIGDLLDLSRLESESWKPRLDRYDVGEILGAVLPKLPAGQRGRVTFDIAERAPEVCVDFAQVVRAITNLVENALDYSAEQVLVRAHTRASLDQVEIEVEDRGPGVADEEKRDIFGKFVRGSASAVKPGGSGLGLAITAEIARSHGGQVRVEDVPGGGARFVLTLPLAKQECP